MQDNTINNNVVSINLPDIPACVDNAVKNLTDIPTRSIGKTVGDLWELVFGPISHAVDKRRMKYAADLEQYRKELTQAIDQIPESNKVEPSLQVVSQALECSKYCVSSEELRKLFVNLISGSINSDYEPYVHPSFAEIIKQMSSIDAQLLREFPTTESGTAPTVDYVIENLRSHTCQTKLKNIIITRLTDCDIDQVSKGVSSLHRLGLISINKELSHADKSLYDFFLQTDYYEKESLLAKALHPNCQLSILKYVSYLTPLGMDFVRVCIHP